jgi:hypothetical protein
LDKELEKLIEASDLETLEEAFRIAKLHWALDFQHGDESEEQRWLAFVKSELPNG